MIAEATIGGYGWILLVGVGVGVFAFVASKTWEQTRAPTKMQMEVQAHESRMVLLEELSEERRSPRSPRPPRCAAGGGGACAKARIALCAPRRTHPKAAA